MNEVWSLSKLSSNDIAIAILVTQHFDNAQQEAPDTFWEILENFEHDCRRIIDLPA